MAKNISTPTKIYREPSLPLYKSRRSLTLILHPKITLLFHLSNPTFYNFFIKQSQLSDKPKIPLYKLSFSHQPPHLSLPRLFSLSHEKRFSRIRSSLFLQIQIPQIRLGRFFFYVSITAFCRFDHRSPISDSTIQTFRLPFLIRFRSTEFGWPKIFMWRHVW